MQYYPSGLPWNDNYQASQQPYKYGSKEFVEMHGLDEYDSQARWYYPALMRTTTQDPLAEKYYDISPYAWCANNPVNLVDPDGKDIFDINHRGEIVNVEENEEYDKFYLLRRNKDNELERAEINISFEYGTVQKYERSDANEKDITWFKINNEFNAADLFKFFADNLNFEFGLITTSKESFVMTRHLDSRVPVTWFAKNLEIYNYNITNIIHNHPGNTDPSGFTDTSPIGDAKLAISFFIQPHRKNVNLYVYRNYPDESLIKYNQNSIEDILPWMFFYNNLNK